MKIQCVRLLQIKLTILMEHRIEWQKRRNTRLQRIENNILPEYPSTLFENFTRPSGVDIESRRISRTTEYKWVHLQRKEQRKSSGDKQRAKPHYYSSPPCLLSPSSFGIKILHLHARASSTKTRKFNRSYLYCIQSEIVGRIISIQYTVLLNRSLVSVVSPSTNLVIVLITIY